MFKTKMLILLWPFCINNWLNRRPLDIFSLNSFFFRKRPRGLRVNYLNKRVTKESTSSFGTWPRRWARQTRRPDEGHGFWLKQALLNKKKMIEKKSRGLNYLFIKMVTKKSASVFETWPKRWAREMTRPGEGHGLWLKQSLLNKKELYGKGPRGLIHQL